MAKKFALNAATLTAILLGSVTSGQEDMDPSLEILPLKDSEATAINLESELMRLESYVGATEDDARELNRIVEIAKQKIPPRMSRIRKSRGNNTARYEHNRAYTFFSEMTQILRDQGYELASKNDVEFVFQGLRNKQFDCDTASLVYVIAAQKLDLPLRLVMTPSHAFTRWDPDNRHDRVHPFAAVNEGDLNLDSTLDKFTGPDADFMRIGYLVGNFAMSTIDPNKMLKSPYMRSLSVQETVSFISWNVADTLTFQGDAVTRGKLLDRAVSDFPNWDKAYRARSDFLEMLGKQKGDYSLILASQQDNIRRSECKVMGTWQLLR